jgi:putative addiction module component (TIGR02574 family)
MHGTKDLIDEATSLPIDERILVVDALLKTINSPNQAVDSTWANTARQRLDALRSGAVRGVPAEEVFARIRGRFVG